MFQAGKLRHRVTIERQVETQDSTTGAVLVSWAAVAEVWASIDPVAAREFIASEAEASKVTTRITIRYRPDVTAKMRAYHAAKDVYYNIEGVLSDVSSGLEYLTLPCSDGVRYDNADPQAVVPVNLSPPLAVGLPTVGLTLTAHNGTWANSPTGYLYQWFQNAVAISGETSSTLIVPNDPGDQLTVRVTAVNGAGAGVPVTSTPRTITL